MIKTIEANGLSFAYLQQGQGPLVLLLHGFPDTAHTWDAVRPALANAGYRAVSPFMRGYAPTEVPADGLYDSDTLGRDVLALIDALGGGPAIVIGHDWGASATYSAVGLEPGKVRFLVTVAVPHPAAIRPGPLLAWRVRHFFQLKRRNAEAKARKNDYALIDALVRRWSPAWDVPPDETRAVKAAFEQPGCLAAAIGYYRALEFKPPASQRKKVTVPTVSFAGEQDGVLSVSQYHKAAKMFGADYRVIAMPGGHFLHREHPERFIKELLAVLPPS
jgi:pimeloyl-ACP methyl ester carboxylesterase